MLFPFYFNICFTKMRDSTLLRFILSVSSIEQETAIIELIMMKKRMNHTHFKISHQIWSVCWILPRRRFWFYIQSSCNNNYKWIMSRRRKANSTWSSLADNFICLHFGFDRAYHLVGLFVPCSANGWIKKIAQKISKSAIQAYNEEVAFRFHSVLLVNVLRNNNIFILSQIKNTIALKYYFFSFYFRWYLHIIISWVLKNWHLPQNSIYNQHFAN